jgi:hypothetical protein
LTSKHQQIFYTPNTVYQRFNTLTFNGTIARIFQVLVQLNYDIGEIDMEFATIDGSIVRVHKAAAGASSKKKMNQKTTPLVAPEEVLPPKSSLLPNETPWHCP